MLHRSQAARWTRGRSRRPLSTSPSGAQRGGLSAKERGRHEQPNPRGRRIVVGLDGSMSSKEALRWAAQQGRLTGAVVDAVICWLHRAMYGRAPASVDRELGHAAGKVLAQAVAEAFGDDPLSQVRESVMLGNAAEVLLERSRRADGRRQPGPWWVHQRVAGSVAQHCV